jgi:phenylalanyl-tRNA synthetase beta chain
VPEPRRIALRVSRVAQILGESVAADEIISLLGGVGFECTRANDGGSVSVTAPSWRSDVTHEVDLVEEVARLRGYDSFPDEIRPFRAGNVPDDPYWILARRIRDTLVGAGLLETRPLPFTNGSEKEGFVRVTNPIAENEAFLRREILDTLARRAEFNLARMHGDVRLFEIGSTFQKTDRHMPHEELRVGALVMGRRLPPHFSDPKSPELEPWFVYGQWDAKGLAEELLRSAYPGEATDLVPGEGATLWSLMRAGSEVGVVKRVALDAPIWAKPAFGIELSLGVISSAQVAPPGKNAHRAPSWPRPTSVPYRPIPSTPPAEFDLALLLPRHVAAKAVESSIRRSAGDLLERLELFDEYSGDRLEGAEGRRSVAWRLTLRHPERTLSAKEIEGRRKKILSALESELDVRQRSL